MPKSGCDAIKDIVEASNCLEWLRKRYPEGAIRDICYQSATQGRHTAKRGPGGVPSGPLQYWVCTGADGRARTDNLLFTKQLLCH